MSVDVTPSELDPKILTTVIEYHSEVEEARREFEDAKERLKHKKNRLEAMQESFEAAFRRLISGAQAGELPLFANQSEMVEAANADPVVSSIVDRLLGYDHDVNAVLVAGYTEDERHQVVAYLDAADAVAEGDEMPEPPAFLTPQPLTPIEIADLMTRLADAGVEVDAERVAAWGLGSRLVVRTWLEACDAVKAEKGDALVADDLPPVPDWLAGGDDEQEVDESHEDAEDAADADRESADAIEETVQ